MIPPPARVQVAASAFQGAIHAPFPDHRPRHRRVEQPRRPRADLWNARSASGGASLHRPRQARSLRLAGGHPFPARPRLGEERERTHRRPAGKRPPVRGFPQGSAGAVHRQGPHPLSRLPWQGHRQPLAGRHPHQRRVAAHNPRLLRLDGPEVGDADRPRRAVQGRGQELALPRRQLPASPKSACASSACPTAAATRWKFASSTP